MFDKIADYLVLRKPAPEIQKRIDLDNLRFIRMISLCVMVLECSMLIAYGVYGNRANPWYTFRIWCYSAYFVAGAICYPLVGFIMKSKASHILLMVAGLSFCVFSAVWGMLISAVDYIGHEQILVYTTNMFCIAGFAFMAPMVSIPFFTILFGIFYYILVHFCGAPLSFPTNYFFLYLILVWISITRYHTKLSDSTIRVEYEKVNQKLMYMSLHDDLTTLKNRRCLAQDALALADTPVCLMILDIDNFKQTNDTHGHDYGDWLLQEVASHLQHVFSPEHVYRYGGDEFIIFMRHNEEVAFAPCIEKLQSDVAAIVQPDATHPVTLSGGYLVGRFADEEHLDALIKQVDQAMYRSKRGGRNRIIAVE